MSAARRPVKGRFNLIVQVEDQYFVANDTWLLQMRQMPWGFNRLPPIVTRFYSAESAAKLMVTKVLGSKKVPPLIWQPSAEHLFAGEWFVIQPIDTDSPLVKAFTRKHWQRFDVTQPQNRFEQVVSDMLEALSAPQVTAPPQRQISL